MHGFFFLQRHKISPIHIQRYTCQRYFFFHLPIVMKCHQHCTKIVSNEKKIPISSCPWHLIPALLSIPLHIYFIGIAYKIWIIQHIEKWNIEWYFFWQKLLKKPPNGKILHFLICRLGGCDLILQKFLQSWEKYFF